MPVFKSEEKLSPEYVPEKLLYRENELKLLKSFFSSLLNEANPFQVRVFITGAVGTGKTSLAKLFGTGFERESRSLGRKVRFAYVNCRINKSLYTVLRRTVEQLGLDLPRRGYSDEEVFEVLAKFLRSSGLRLILCLDEVEALISEEGGEAVYFLTRMGEGVEEAGLVSLMLIFREPDFLERLDTPTLSGMGGNNIHLSEYDYTQLLEILRYRAEEAFNRNALGDEVLEFIAQAAAERKDARYAIDILWRSGKYAEADGSSTVEAEHVRKALASVYPTIRRENLAYLSKDERIVLLASARGLAGNRTAITASDLFQYYKVVCEELKTEAKGYTTFWETLQQLQDLGFLRLSIRSEGARGRKTYIYLPGIPVQLLEKELMKDVNF
ncbi:MAG: AAA family ATPase [Candidatus Caldarchaeum sp.]|nr:AAA family ATPase [Candidatus Caldarchaeum sp.]MDW7977844.1 AAA family ATPase [Candidatus Caldarchaeum sp.]MDW8360073.1 AAA family ATPase [Candidatus Caldarchaeum sp.]